MGAVFNITSSEYALAAWGAFALLIAYRYGLRIMLAAGLALLVLWASALVAARFGAAWSMFPERPEHFLIAGAVLFFVPWMLADARHPDFPPVYRAAGALVVFAALLALSEGAFSYLAIARQTREQIYGLLALCVSMGAIALGVRRAWNGVVYVATGFFTLFLFLRLHHWLWDWLPNYLFFALLGGIALVLLVVFKRLRVRMEAA